MQIWYYVIRSSGHHSPTRGLVPQGYSPCIPYDVLHIYNLYKLATDNMYSIWSFTVTVSRCLILLPVNICLYIYIYTNPKYAILHYSTYILSLRAIYLLCMGWPYTISVPWITLTSVLVYDHVSLSTTYMYTHNYHVYIYICMWVYIYTLIYQIYKYSFVPCI